MSNLYEINDQIDHLAEQLVDPETGEINDEILETLDKLEMEKGEKIEYLALKVKNIRADVDAYKAEKDNFDKRIKQDSNKADNIERYIANNLKGENFSTPKVKIGWRRSQAVEIVNAEVIPDEYMLCKTEMRPQKTLIKQALKEGKEIPGAMLQERNNISIK